MKFFPRLHRIEAIRLFLAFASFMGFPVYQMDVKSAFLYGTIEEELGNEIRSSFLLENGLGGSRTIDKTLFAEEKDCDIYCICLVPEVFDASRPDIYVWMSCACARDSPFELEAFSDSDYGSASLDKKSTSQIVIMEAPVLTRNQQQNKLQLLTVVGKTKHIEIRHHFIRDCYEKRLIDVIKIHTDANVRDLLTKGFDVIRFNFLVMIDFRWKDVRFGDSFYYNGMKFEALPIWLLSLENLVLLGKFGAARQIWCCKENLVLSGKFGAARKKFVLLVTVTTVARQKQLFL
ncbi:ribonuclease H-like domain-containing protein [Tanacetum coccineum]